MKKFLKFGIIFSFCMLMFCFGILLQPKSESKVFGTTVEVDAGGSCGDGVTWRIDDIDGIRTLTIGYTGSGTGIMNEYESEPLTGNYTQPWKNYNKNIKSIVIQSGVTRIGGRGFEHIPYSTLYVPSTLTSIGHYAFSKVGYDSQGAFVIWDSSDWGVQYGNCLYRKAYVDGILNNYWALEEAVSSQTSYEINTNAKFILNSAFLDVNGLETIEIPSNIIYIGENAFSRYSGLLNSENYIESGNAYYINWIGHGKILLGVNDTSVEEFTFASNTVIICLDSFSDCKYIEEIKVPEGVIYIDGNAFNIVGDEFDSALKIVDLPSTLRELRADYVFYGCKNLEKIICRASVPPIVVIGSLFGDDEGNDGYDWTLQVPNVEAYQNSSWGSYIDNIKNIVLLETSETGVLVDIVLPTVFVALVGTLACMYVLQGRKQKKLIIG